MGKGVNLAVLAGTLEADPELKYTTAGQATCRIRLKVEDGYVQTDGTYKARTLFMTCIAWGKKAEALAVAIKRDEFAVVTGRISYRTYVQGEVKRSVTEIQIESVVGGKVAEAQAGLGHDDRPAQEEEA